MKKCTCFGNRNDIIKWEAPGNKGRFLHICTRCGYAEADADAELLYTKTEEERKAATTETFRRR